MATIRQKKALANVVENGGNVSKAMIDAGYSEATAKTPQKLTESKAWQELMQDHLPDDLLVKVHREGLAATKLQGVGGMVMKFDEKGSVDKLNHSDIEVPDYATRHKYLDTAYKLKGLYAPEKSVQVQVKGEVKDFAKYQKVKEKFEAELLESIESTDPK